LERLSRVQLWAKPRSTFEAGGAVPSVMLTRPDHSRPRPRPRPRPKPFHNVNAYDKR